jgi:transcriptional regulator with XRE-family HTH domain
MPDVIRSAFYESGLSAYELGMKAGVYPDKIRRYLRGERGLGFSKVEKIANVLGLNFVRDAGAGTTETPAKPATQSMPDVIRSAFYESGLSFKRLASASGVAFYTCRRLILGENDPGFASIAEPRFSSVEKIANVLGVKLVRDAEASTTETPAKPPARNLKDAMLSAFYESGLSADELSRASRVDINTIRRLVRGDSEPRLKLLEKIANVLGVKLVRDAEANGTESHVKPPAQSMSDVIRSAVVECGLSAYELGLKSGLCSDYIFRFVRGEGDLAFATVEKIANFLGLKVVRDAEVRRPEPKPLKRNPHMDKLRSAIDDSGLCFRELAKRSGISRATIRKICNGYDNLSYINFIKLANALGLKLDQAELAMIQGWPDALTPSAAGPISAPLDSATIKDTSTDLRATITQADAPARPNDPRTKRGPTWPPGRCPVSFDAEGRVVDEGKIKKLRRSQLNVITALIDAGADGLTGDDLGSKSGGFTGYRSILDTLRKQEYWLARIRMAGGPGGHYRLAMPGDS